MKYQNPKGTVDFYPKDMMERNAIFNKLRDTAVKYNYKEVESPAFESLKLLTAKSGDEIKEQIFVLEKKGKEEFGLRFDLTVPVARMFVEKQKSLTKPAKWFYLTRMWRYEQPQSGRLREFYQFGVEVFGSAKPEADAEVINLAIDSLMSLGLKEDDFVVKINNRKLIQGILTQIVGKEKLDKVLRAIDKKGKLSEKEFIEELEKTKMGLAQVEEVRDILEIEKIEDFSKLKLNKEAFEGLEELKGVLEFIYFKELVKISLSTVRGLAYYTGTVFEIFDQGGKFRSICGGGRYDKMIEQFGGQPEPATGFAIGYSTLYLLLAEKDCLPVVELCPDYFVAYATKDVKQAAFDICRKLREKYVVEIDLTDKNLKNQFNYANKIGAKKVIVVGPDELKENKVNIKDMKTGAQETIAIDKL